MKCPFLCKWNTWQSGCTKPTLERCPHGRAVDCLCGAGRVSNETQPCTDPKPETKAGDIIYGGGGGGGTMREILFRGYSTIFKKWYFGSYLYLDKPVHNRNSQDPVETDPVHYIVTPDGQQHTVDPATVGQYAGLPDKNGKRIFEGDIVESVYTKRPYVVCFGEYTYTDDWGDRQSACGWYNIEKGGYVSAFGSPDTWAIVIGNIHDNPELLEEEG